MRQAEVVLEELMVALDSPQYSKIASGTYLLACKVVHVCRQRSSPCITCRILVAEQLVAELLVAEPLVAEPLVAEQMVAELLVAEPLVVEQLVVLEMAV